MPTLHLYENFHSSHLASDRHVIVYTPPGYDLSPGRRYPTLYMHDGQNLFDPNTSFLPGNYWRFGETADWLAAEGSIDPPVVVGIYNAGDARADEYTHVFDARVGRGGKAHPYGRAIVEEIKPFVDARFRTLDGPEFTGVGGASLGGLAALAIGLANPNVFGRIAALSPSIWWGGRDVVRFVRALPYRPPTKIWLDFGTREGRSQAGSKAMAAGAIELRDALVARGWSTRSDLRFRLVAGGTHDEASWATRVDPLLRFLYRRRPARARARAR